jgi:hypothetical protein
VLEIGLTLLFLDSWDNPIPLTRVWCLYEIACSQELQIALSKKQRALFHTILREDRPLIEARICQIDVEKASSFLPGTFAMF